MFGCFEAEPHHLHNAVLGAIQTEACKTTKFSIAAYHFLMIQQLFLPLGHPTKRRATFCLLCSPCLNACYRSLLFVQVLFLTKSTF